MERKAARRCSPAKHARKKATTKNTQLLSLVAVALLLAFPSCNTNTNDGSDPTAPVVEKACFEPGDPERKCDPLIIISPQPDQPLRPVILIDYRLGDCHGTCGPLGVELMVTYHKGGQLIFEERLGIIGANLPFRLEIPSSLRGCDLVCIYLTTCDELGPIDDPVIVPLVPGPERPNPHRVPQDWVEP